jgi:small basic protein (TIGR04137 family)
MSMDPSLKSKSTLERHRNVLSRAERIAILKETGVWTEEMGASGLPKVAHRKAAVGKKSKVEKDAAAAAAAAGAAPAEGAAAAAPAEGAGKAAAGAKPGAGAKPAAAAKPTAKTGKK